MTLSEIETTLEELAIRHPNLDTALLTTLLTSAGWDDKTIKEALVLFSQRKPKDTGTVTTTVTTGAISSPDAVSHQIAPITPATPVVPTELPKAEITFYQPDGSEEGELHAFAEGAVPKTDERTKVSEVISQKVEEPVEIKESITQHDAAPEQKTEHSTVTVEPEKNIAVTLPTVPANILVTVPDPVIAPVVRQVQSENSTKDPESLIISQVKPEKKLGERVAEIPGNLPLLPFESSPHIWSFSHYKDIFHKDTPIKEEIKVISVMPEELKQQVYTANKPQEEKPVLKKVIPDEEVIIDKVPYNREDGSLVFLAAVMLFVIILILGYMYSNGRL